MKRILSIVLTMVLCLSISATTSTQAAKKEIDYGDPIEVISYIDEEGRQVTERYAKLIL